MQLPDAAKEFKMVSFDRGKDRSSGKELLSCDSKKCMKLSEGLWKERFEDLVFGVGP
jgi:hypothetical protein